MCPRVRSAVGAFTTHIVLGPSENEHRFKARTHRGRNFGRASDGVCRASTRTSRRFGARGSRPFDSPRSGSACRVRGLLAATPQSSRSDQTSVGDDGECRTTHGRRRLSSRNSDGVDLPLKRRGRRFWVIADRLSFSASSQSGSFDRHAGLPELHRRSVVDEIPVTLPARGATISLNIPIASTSMILSPALTTAAISMNGRGSGLDRR
jgi:hypothetical protein